jgi:hypothetical protein
MAVTDLRDLGGRQCERLRAAIHDHEIVAEAVHLGEAQLHCLPESCGGAGVAAGCCGWVCGFWSGMTSGPLLPQPARAAQSANNNMS